MWLVKVPSVILSAFQLCTFTRISHVEKVFIIAPKLDLLYACVCVCVFALGPDDYSGNYCARFALLSLKLLLYAHVQYVIFIF